MIEDYRRLAVFVAVADAGSFSQAGRQLKLSTSVVSHHIGKLEERLGVSLIYRSTRALSLTQEGQSILPSARRMVIAAEEAVDALSDTSEQPVGAIRITLPGFGERSDIHTSLWAFAREYPMVAISLHSSDHPVDLVKDGYDLAIRLGVMKDSALKSRRIGEFRRVLVASPGYLEKVPPITSIAELSDCEFISIAMLSEGITLLRDGEEIEFEPEYYRLEVSSVTAAKMAVLAGLGIQRLPLSEVKAELEAGQLVQVLPEWSLPVQGVYAVWPDMGPQKKLTRRLIDFFAARKIYSSES